MLFVMQASRFKPNFAR